MCVTHGMPCVNMRGTLRAINMGAQIQFVGGAAKRRRRKGKEKGRKGEKKGGKIKKKGKKKRGEEKGGREEKERGNGRNVAK